MKTKEEKKPVVICKGKLCSNHCRDCAYFDTSRPEASGSRYYKCAQAALTIAVMNVLAVALFVANE